MRDVFRKMEQRILEFWLQGAEYLPSHPPPPRNISTAIGQSESIWNTPFFQNLAWQTGSGPTRNTGHAGEAKVGCRSLLAPCGF